MMSVRTQSVIRMIVMAVEQQAVCDVEKAIISVLGNDAFEHISFQQYENMRAKHNAIHFHSPNKDNKK